MSESKQHQRRLYTKMAIRVILTLVIAYVVLFAFSAYTIWTFGQKNEVATTDAAIVLGAAVDGDQPSPVFRERIRHAVWLYKQELVRNIIFTGGTDHASQPSEAEVARRYAITQGVKEDDIFTDTTSRWTTENIQHAAAIARSHGWQTFTLVSDPLHMRRAQLIAETEGLKAYSSPTTTSAYTSLSTQIPFLLRETFFYTGYLMTIPFR
ncbi:YdcF family protein [Paenibacillus wenxiniae]|uniref:YdcF family protein n=1 Tax=Paenibacillus wenxiniae TaxID=1636843 RepID=A0ABW4RQ55_9BACL